MMKELGAVGLDRVLSFLFPQEISPSTSASTSHTLITVLYTHTHTALGFMAFKVGYSL